MFNKKGDGGLTAIVIILIVLIFLGWLVNIGRRECNSNKECGKDYYCGSDFKCHQYPDIQRTITQVDYTRPALIIGIAIIIAALVLKYFNVKKEEKIEKESEKEEKIEVKKVKKPSTKETKKEDYVATYYNYPSYSPYIKSEGKKKKEYLVKQIDKKSCFSNNYVGMILGGLLALGVILATSLDYIGVAVFGAAILFIAVYKLWSYCIEYNAEIYLIAILSLIYITLALIYFSKSGIIFPLIGLGFLVITLFVVKETVSWLGWKSF